jgi:hypothetical protein
MDTQGDTQKDTEGSPLCLFPKTLNGNVYGGAGGGHGGGGGSRGGGEAKRAVGGGAVVVSGGVRKLPRLEMNHHYGSVSVFCSPA